VTEGSEGFPVKDARTGDNIYVETPGNSIAFSKIFKQISDNGSINVIPPDENSHGSNVNLSEQVTIKTHHEKPF
jgi:hypothetical protein